MAVISPINYSPKGFPGLSSHLHRPVAFQRAHAMDLRDICNRNPKQACLDFLNAQSTKRQQPIALNICSKLGRDLGKLFTCGPCRETVSALQFSPFCFVELVAAEFMCRTPGVGAVEGSNLLVRTLHLQCYWKIVLCDKAWNLGNHSWIINSALPFKKLSFNNCFIGKIAQCL